MPIVLTSPLLPSARPRGLLTSAVAPILMLAGLTACKEGSEGTVAPAEGASAAVSATAAPVGSAGERAGAPDGARSAFFVVATVAGRQARQLGERVVIGNDWWASREGIREDYMLRKGVYKGYQPRWFGAFPHAAWVQHYLEMGGCCTRVSHHFFTYRWYGDHFERRHTYKNNERLLAVSAPSKELAFALVGNEPQARLFAIHEEAKLTAALSALEGVEVVAPNGERSQPPKVPGCKTALRVDAVSGDKQRPLLVLPDGHVMVAGKSCWDAGKSLLVDVISPRQTQGTVYQVTPSREPVMTYAGDHQPMLVGSAKDNVYLLQRDTASLHHFDGKGWKAVEVPQRAPIHDLNVGPDGVLWIAGDSGLYRRVGAAWEAATLPLTGAVRPLPSSVALHPDGSVWVVGAAGSSRFLMTNVKSDWVFPLQTCKTPYLEIDVEYPKIKVDLEAVGKQLAKVPGASELAFGLDDGTHGRHLGAALPSLQLGRHIEQEIEQIDKHVARLLCATRKHTLKVNITIPEGEKPTAAPPAPQFPSLNNKLATFAPEKLPPVGAPPEGTSPRPDPFSWAGTPRVEVPHARSLGCTVRTKQEWVRFDCGGVGDFKQEKGPHDRQKLVVDGGVVVAALRPGLVAVITGTTRDGESRTLTIRYDEGGKPQLGFDKPATSSATLYPRRYLQRSVDMVQLPAGEGPNGPVKAFSIDRTEVSVGAFLDCVAGDKCKLGQTSKCWKTSWSLEPADSRGVFCVSQKQAQAFCAAHGKRLPSADEWMYAAFGAGDGTVPWRGMTHSSDVGAFPAGQSRFGVFDLATGVAEWTQTEEDGKFVVLGSRNSKAVETALTLDNLTKKYREPLDAGTRARRLGFRCAKDGG